jgi:hypothetical protein
MKYQKSAQWELCWYLWVGEWTNMTNLVGTLNKYANTPNYTIKNVGVHSTNVGFIYINVPGNVPYCVVSSFYLYIQFVVIESERWAQLIIHRMIVILKVNFKINHRIYFLQEESFFLRILFMPVCLSSFSISFQLFFGALSQY